MSRSDSLRRDIGRQHRTLARGIITQEVRLCDGHAFKYRCEWKLKRFVREKGIGIIFINVKLTKANAQYYAFLARFELLLNTLFHVERNN